MNPKKLRFKVTSIISIIVGLGFSAGVNVGSGDRSLQLSLLAFLIGFSIVWMIYLAVWFVSTGSERTAFPRHSENIVKFFKKNLRLDPTDYQEKTLLEVVGTMLMIAIGLFLAGAGFLIISGLLYLAGWLS